MQPSNSAKGFGAVEGLIIVMVVIALAFGGWWVWQKNQNAKTEDKSDNTAQTNNQNGGQSGQDEEVVDSTDTWLTYSSEEGKFSLRYPSSWKLPKNVELCPESTFLTGPDDETVGICQSDKLGQVSVSSTAGDQRSLHEFRSTEYKDITESDVVVQGVGGVKRTGTFNLQDDLIAYGTKRVTYVFYTNNRTYKATYSQAPEYPDMLSVFEKMVKETLKFVEYQ